jgi:hypothetical protein
MRSRVNGIPLPVSGEGSGRTRIRLVMFGARETATSSDVARPRGASGKPACRSSAAARGGATVRRDGASGAVPLLRPRSPVRGRADDVGEPGRRRLLERSARPRRWVRVAPGGVFVRRLGIRGRAAGTSLVRVSAIALQGHHSSRGEPFLFHPDGERHAIASWRSRRALERRPLLVAAELNDAAMAAVATVAGHPHSSTVLSFRSFVICSSPATRLATAGRPGASSPPSAGQCALAAPAPLSRQDEGKVLRGPTGQR